MNEDVWGTWLKLQMSFEGDRVQCYARADGSLCAIEHLWIAPFKKKEMKTLCYLIDHRHVG